jgi:pre-rRNA-processing protein TSR4
LSNLSISSASTSTLSPPHPAYQPPQYLSTTDEYLPPPEEVDLDSDDDEQSPEEKAEWRDERFEQLFPSGVDPLFERFVKRISEADGAGGQVLR